MLVNVNKTFSIYIHVWNRLARVRALPPAPVISKMRVMQADRTLRS
jgi:hypothetical protein